MLNPGKANASKATSTRGRRPKGKKRETREKILRAALEIFTRHPYHTASIRMISSLAEIDHPLIGYYFGSKADLFRTVITQLLKQRKQLQKNWYAETKTMDAARGMSRYIDHILDDYRKRPGLFHIISLNVPQADHKNPIPGYDIIQEFLKTDIGGMKNNLNLQVPDHEGEMFVRAMSMLLVGFLGGAGSYAKALGMDPDSIVYYNWVRDTILYTLLPRFETMVKK